MQYRIQASCFLVVMLNSSVRAQSPVTEQPVAINLAAVGKDDIFAKSFLFPGSCSIAASASIADPTIVKVNPTSETSNNGSTQFDIVALKIGSTTVTITYNLSGSGCGPNSEYIQPLNVTVAASGGGSPITGLANNYSYISAGLPNYGIAQGSIFDIFGTGLAPSETPLQNVPLSTSLNGVTVTVTVNGTTTNVILYYVTPTQIAGILPSNTPLGTGTLSVLNNGTLVGTTPILVVQSAFGILTLNSAGTGQAAAFDVNNNYVGFTNALNPGDYVVLWGTGVGPVPADTNETVTQTAANLSNVPMSAWIGGVPATVYYHGRSQYPGLDQVILVVPQGVTPGCYVSVATQSGNIVSNFATLPIAASGRICQPSLGFAGGYLTALTKGSVQGGAIWLDKLQWTLRGTPLSTDLAGAEFFDLTLAQFNAQTQPIDSPGSCTVLPYNPLNPLGLPNIASMSALNAGPNINVSGPSATAQIPFANNAYIDVNTPLGGSFFSGQQMLPTVIPATGGTFTVSNGSGTSALGAFSASVTLGSGGILTWTNESSITTVNRANGVTVNWSGAGTNTFVVVSGISLSHQAPYAGAVFLCTAPAAAGTFTVPPHVLLSLPAGGNGQTPANSLHVSQVLEGLTFSAPGLDAGTITSAYTYMDLVTYQ